MHIHRQVTRDDMAGKVRQLRADGKRFDYSILSSGARDLSWRVGTGYRYYSVNSRYYHAK